MQHEQYLTSHLRDNSQFLDTDPVFSFIQSIDASYEEEFKTDKLKVSYLITSAMTGENIREAFQILAENLLTHQKILNPYSGHTLS